MLRKKVIVTCFLLTAVFLLPYTGLAEASPVLTLERAKELAGTQGNLTKITELEYQQAEAQLEATKKELGVGVLTQEELRKSLEHMEKVIREWENAVELLKGNIAAWEEELKDPGAQATRLEQNIRQAEEDIARYRQKIEETHKERSKLLLIMPQVEGRDEQVKTYLDPLETALGFREDANLIQPKIVDYQVEAAYHNLLTFKQREQLLAKALEIADRELEIERLKLELGLSTSLQVKQKEEKLKQAENSLLESKVQEEELKRTLRQLVGLPLDFDFTLSPVSLGPISLEPLDTTSPDLTRSVAYLRALETVRKKQEDLDDIKDDNLNREKRRLAEHDLKMAELKLEETLTRLESNYLSRKENFHLAVSAAENAALSLEQAQSRLETATLQHDLGMLSPLDLDQAGLALMQAELASYSAQVQKQLAFKAYLLALEGIEIQPY